MARILQKSYSIDSIIADTYKRQILREAIKPFAEEIKIEMSFKDKINYISPLGSLPFEDENGEEPEIEVDLSESELERVLGPIFQKAIDITKGLLKRNNLKGSDLGALILVGGPTFSPILRRMLKEQITESVDTSVDPMTVVAKGAALFASTISVSDEVKEETRDKTKLQLDLKYEATSADIDEMLNLKVLKDKTTGKIPEKLFIVLDRTSKGVAWSSTQKELSLDKVNLIQEIQLEKDEANTFAIILTDENGNHIKSDCGGFKVSDPRMNELLTQIAKKMDVQFDDPKKANYISNKDQMLRAYIWNNQDQFIGKTIMLEAQEICLAEDSKTYSLRFPVGICFRDDK